MYDNTGALNWILQAPTNKQAHVHYSARCPSPEQFHQSDANCQQLPVQFYIGMIQAILAAARLNSSSALSSLLHTGWEGAAILSCLCMGTSNTHFSCVHFCRVQCIDVTT